MEKETKEELNLDNPDLRKKGNQQTTQIRGRMVDLVEKTGAGDWCQTTMDKGAGGKRPGKKDIT